LLLWGDTLAPDTCLTSLVLLVENRFHFSAKSKQQKSEEKALKTMQMNDRYCSLTKS
jgi:hypothetical protein